MTDLLKSIDDAKNDIEIKSDASYLIPGIIEVVGSVMALTNEIATDRFMSVYKKEKVNEVILGYLPMKNS